jgi:hypothetical protein
LWSKLPSNVRTALTKMNNQLKGKKWHTK